MGNLAPGVYSTERDLTLFMRPVATSIGAFVGDFKWGECDTVTLVQDTEELTETFGKPGLARHQDYFSAYSFLSYSNALKVVRTVSDTAASANNGNTAGVLVKNKPMFDLTNFDLPSLNNISFLARCPGELGNSLQVIVMDNATFAGAPSHIKGLFPNAPGTSDYAYQIAYELAPGTTAERKATAALNKDEMHIAVIDVQGVFSGIPGSVLETFAFVSKALDGRDSDNNPKYFKEVINRSSRYIYATGQLFFLDVGRPISNIPFGNFSEVIVSNLANGSDGAVPAVSDYIESWNEFDDFESVAAQLFFVGEAGGHKVQVYQHIVDNIMPKRDDAVTCVAVRKTDVVGLSQSAGLAGCQAFVQELGRSTSYGISTSGWKAMFDPFNDRTVHVPCCADLAGTMAYTDSVAESFYSPAGLNRGSIKNITGLLWNPKGQTRGELDAIRVNPIISTTAHGYVLFGDRTMFAKESVFSFINVRRLFNLLKTKIKYAAIYSLFEFNDPFTRRAFVASIEPELRSVKAKRGATDYLIVCDDTNNTADVVDAGEFVAEIMVKPARSIQRVRLIFTAVRNSVTFSEVIG